MRNIYYFGADWCPSCKRLKPHFDKLIQDSNLTATYVDVDDNPGMAEAYGVKSLPTIIVEDTSNRINTVKQRLVNPTPPEIKYALVAD